MIGYSKPEDDEDCKCLLLSSKEKCGIHKAALKAGSGR